MASIIWWLWEQVFYSVPDGKQNQISLLKFIFHAGQSLLMSCWYDLSIRPYLWQVKHGTPDVPLPSFSQVLLWAHKACQSQMRYVIPSMNPEPTSRSPPSWKCLETILRSKTLRKYPNLAFFVDQANLWSKVILFTWFHNFILFLVTIDEGWNVLLKGS